MPIGSITVEITGKAKWLNRQFWGKRREKEEEKEEKEEEEERNSDF